MTYTMRDMPAPLAPHLVEKALKVETATIGHRRFMGFVDPEIQAVHGYRIAGTAVTLALPGQDSTLLHHIIQYLRPGDVLVIDRLGDRRHACLGGAVACALKTRGTAGVLIDGPCTDVPEIVQYDLPVWCRGPSPITTRLYDVGGAFNVDIQCGGAVVHPGDLVICDFSGALVLPADEAEAEVDWALGKQRLEPASHLALKAGAYLGIDTGATEKVLAKL
ncbi:RraA family protein [Acuticoccus kandeliae]|uniref:RraA family protein n=1 Tax=Acuticoccus kandeliae TaxID=2073160 RepID=UPI000D3EA6B6|nr:RraA family protein [Acuticoccus kandeliae]